MWKQKELKYSQIYNFKEVTEFTMNNYSNMQINEGDDLVVQIHKVLKIRKFYEDRIKEVDEFIEGEKKSRENKKIQLEEYLNTFEDTDAPPLLGMAASPVPVSGNAGYGGKAKCRVRCSGRDSSLHDMA